MRCYYLSKQHKLGTAVFQALSYACKKVKRLSCDLVAMCDLCVIFKRVLTNK